MLSKSFPQTHTHIHTHTHTHTHKGLNSEHAHMHTNSPVAFHVSTGCFCGYITVFHVLCGCGQETVG